MFWEILLSSSRNVDDYVAHIYKEYLDLHENNKLADLGWEVLQYDQLT